MNILLTGATGYLGSNLLSRLVEGGHRVTAIVRKSSSLQRIAALRDQITIYTIGDSSLSDLFQTNRIETVIHCATQYGRGDTDPSALVEANLTMPLQLLQAGSAAGARCFINTDTILDKSVSAYALSKSQFREWLGRYAEKMVCVNVALEHFYGPHDDATKFVGYILKQLLDGVPSIDLTLGEQKRDFIYIDDIVSAFSHIANHCASLKSGYIAYEVGTGVTITIRDFVELAKQITGNTHTRLNFGAVPYRKNEPMETVVNTDAIRTLGWFHTISVADGLARIVAQERETKSI